MPGSETKTFVADALQALFEGGPDLGSMDATLPALSALVAEVAAPDFACVMNPLPPTPPVSYDGAEGVAQAWEDYSQAFEEIRAVLEGVSESDDAIVIFVKQIAVTRHGGVEISQPSAMAFIFEANRLARLELHLDQDAARRAAGLA